MVEKNIIIKLKSGLEARPVAHLVQIASQYDSTIHLVTGTKKINAKSIMGMMTLGLTAGEEVLVIADGQDEQEAVKKIEEYLSAE